VLSTISRRWIRIAFALALADDTSRPELGEVMPETLESEEAGELVDAAVVEIAVSQLYVESSVFQDRSQAPLEDVVEAK